MAKLTLFFKGLLINTFPLKGAFIIGRNPKCTIHIDSLSVAPKHAEVFHDNKGWVIRSISDTKQTLVNHSSITEHQLSHGDHLQVGKYTLSFSEDVAQPSFLQTDVPMETEKEQDIYLQQIEKSAAHLPEGYIQILNGPHVGKVIPLQKSLTRLGLDGNDCAMVAHRGDGYFISHLEGDTPPKVNQSSIESHSLRLKEGQIIILGQTHMRFYEEMLQPVAISNSA